MLLLLLGIVCGPAPLCPAALCPCSLPACPCAHTCLLPHPPWPPADGFGGEGRGAEVPPGATLEIDLTLLGWHKMEKITGAQAGLGFRAWAALCGMCGPRGLG